MHFTASWFTRRREARPQTPKNSQPDEDSGCFGCWPSRKPNTVHAQSNGQPLEDDWGDSDHSDRCPEFNALSLQDSGYIDKGKLELALGEIFRNQGLSMTDFGIMVRIQMRRDFCRDATDLSTDTQRPLVLLRPTESPTGEWFQASYLQRVLPS